MRVYGALLTFLLHTVYAFEGPSCIIGDVNRVYDNYEVCPPSNSTSRTHPSGLAVLSNECLSPSFFTVHGKIPVYLNGVYLHVLPAVFNNSFHGQVPSTSFLHSFDGLPVVHRWEFANGAIKFNSDFLRRGYYDMYSSNTPKVPLFTQAVIGVHCRDGGMTCTRPLSDDIENIFTLFLKPLTNVQPLQVQLGYNMTIMLTDTFPVTAFDVDSLETGNFYGWGSMAIFNNFSVAPIAEQLTHLLWLTGATHPHHIRVGPHKGKMIRPAVELKLGSLLEFEANKVHFTVVDHEMHLTDIGSFDVRGYPYAHSFFDAGRFMIFPEWAWFIDNTKSIVSSMETGLVSIAVAGLEYRANSPLRFSVFDILLQKLTYTIELPELHGWTNLHTVHAYAKTCATGQCFVLIFRRDLLDGDVYADLSLDKLNAAYRDNQTLLDIGAIRNMTFYELTISCHLDITDLHGLCLFPHYIARDIQPDGYEPNYIPGKRRNVLDFPIINSAFVAGAAARYVWFASHPGIVKMRIPAHGSTEKLELLASWALDCGQLSSEPRFVQDPSRAHLEDGGVLLVEVTDTPNNRGFMVVLDAATLNVEAKVVPPPNQNFTNPLFPLHTTWIDRSGIRFFQ